MKKCLAIVVILFIGHAAKAQVFLDAIKLKENYDPRSKTILLNVGTKEILKKYVDSSLHLDLTKYYNVQGPNIDPNPFIELSGGAHGLATINSIKETLPSVGGLNVTNFADGLARFLVERTKQELNSTFFQKFKNDLNKSEELKALFPSTYKVLNTIDNEIYMFDAYLNTLKEAFVKDMTNFYTGFNNVCQLDKYKQYFKNNPEIYSVLKNSLYLINQYSRGIHPGKVLADYDTSMIYFNGKTTEKNAQTCILLAKIFSESIKSKSPDRYWVSYDSVSTQIQDPVFRNIYFGLIFQQSKNRNIEFEIVAKIRFDTILVRAKDSLTYYQHFVETIASQAQQAEEYLSDIKSRKKSEIDFNDYYNLYNSALDLIQGGFQVVNLPGVALSNEKEILRQSDRWLAVARSTGALYVDVRTKNYASAVIEVTVLLDSIFINTSPLFFPVKPVVLTTAELKAVNAFLSKGEINGKTNPTSGVEENISTFIDSSIFNNFNLSKKDSLINYLNRSVILERIKNNKDNIDKILISIPEEIKLRDFIESKLRLVGSLKDTAYKILYRQLEQFLMAEKEKLISSTLKYGTFAAAMAQAQNPEEVKAAIEAIALPAGSSRVKRETAFNVALNAYVGMFAGNEDIKGVYHEKGINSFGITAPVGFSISRGHSVLFLGTGKKGWKKGTRGWSTSLMLSVIDLGTLVSYRFKNDSTSTIPEIKLQDIFSPGAFISIGIPKCPVSVNFGTQIGPNLRKVYATSADNNVATNIYVRWSLSLCMDIPLINLYTRTKK